MHVNVLSGKLALVCNLLRHLNIWLTMLLVLFQLNSWETNVCNELMVHYTVWILLRKSYCLLALRQCCSSMPCNAML